MIDQHFALLAAAIDLTGVGTYAWATLRGRVQPNRVTWVLWLIAPAIAFVASVSAGAGLSSALTFVAGFGPALVLIASFCNKRAYWSLSRFDIVCGVLSVVALGAWAVTRTAWVAIIFSILADALAAAPTIRKAHLFPATESATVFSIGVVSGLITLASIPHPDFSNTAFATYLTLVCTLLSTLIIRGQRREKAHQALSRRASEPSPGGA